jgi:sulfate adenylyltransferase subunit 1/sulfate transport system substrate-binding protein
MSVVSQYVEEDLQKFPKIELITVDKTFGGWTKAQKKHFADGGIFDEIQKQNSAQ